jgi:exodeoxyribonuclease-3
VWHGQPRHHDVAILARGEKPREVRRGLPGNDADVQARYLEADVFGLRVASVYLPNGNPTRSPTFQYKLAWFERFNRYAWTLLESKQDVVLAGDFNVVPTNADIYNPWAWQFDAVMQPETRQAYQMLLGQGWVDATRHLHPAERIYTFWVNADAFNRNAGFRMDFLLLSPRAAGRLSRAEVDKEYRGREKPSDHTPAWVELQASPAVPTD